MSRVLRGQGTRAYIFLHKFCGWEIYSDGIWPDDTLAIGAQRRGKYSQVVYQLYSWLGWLVSLGGAELCRKEVEVILINVCNWFDPILLLSIIDMLSMAIVCSFGLSAVRWPSFGVCIWTGRTVIFLNRYIHSRYDVHFLTKIICLSVTETLQCYACDGL